ncbi:hypothetical protein [Oryza sativa Japonica Group]|uniref:Uncharacterized protein n=1 Tax=Oryza sativa subsp. japonica TaxID=39947 RepID=Q5JLN8_ORYSJ|nr:hypothetical protein [Oryza sativa Japonica Group]
MQCRANKVLTGVESAAHLDENDACRRRHGQLAAADKPAVAFKSPPGRRSARVRAKEREWRSG